jgi:hypothetical protein
MSRTSRPHKSAMAEELWYACVSVQSKHVWIEVWVSKLKYGMRHNAFLSEAMNLRLKCGMYVCSVVLYGTDSSGM